MRRWRARARHVLRSAPYAAAVAVLMAPVAVAAQEWNSPRALELARRAVERRSGQIAATTVAAYSAEARGYLTFLGAFGDTAIIRPKVVKQTQLAVRVFWQAPSSSKQIVVGMRDTLLTPADIGYYADRYGIVQSNFPDRIRLGDGRDVSDVLHPLAPAGLHEYDFAVGDSLSITTATQRIDVYQLRFRPRDPSQARAMGSAYVDVSGADIVRLDLTFTRAAILDKRIEYLMVSLENTLLEGRAWLPRRQQIEVVRSGTWLRFEGRGIIRGRWDVCCYDVTFQPEPRLFTGPPIVFAPLSELRRYEFEGGILDGLPPDVSVVRAEDLERVQREAEELVRLRFREQAQPAALAVPRVSDLVRVTRAEGIAVGAAGMLRPVAGAYVDVRGRYGFSDREWKGEAGLRVSLGGDRSVRLFALRDYVEARDVPEGSGIRNTVAAQEFGSDHTDPYDVRAVGAELRLGRWARARWRVVAAREEHDSLTVRASPERGHYERLIPAVGVRATRASVFADAASFGLAGGTLRVSSELRLVSVDTGSNVARVSLDAEFERRVGAGSLVARTVAAAVSGGDVAPQFLVYFGGPTTAPGYAFDAFGARHGVSQRIEWRTTVPFVPLALGRFGRTPGHATLAPFAHVVWVNDPEWRGRGVGGTEGSSGQGWYPAVGLAIEPLLEVVRVEVARGLRDGRWTFSLDVSRAFWGVL